MDGKAMVVCMSRRICVELYRRDHRAAARVARRDDEQGAIKVVMTGSAPIRSMAAAHPQQGGAGRRWRSGLRIRTTRSGS